MELCQIMFERIRPHDIEHFWVGDGFDVLIKINEINPYKKSRLLLVCRFIDRFPLCRRTECSNEFDFCFVRLA